MKNSILLKVFIALALGVAVGAITGDAEIVGIPWTRIYHLIGKLFLNALTLVVVPLIASSIIVGSARLGQDQQFGKLGRRTLGLFLLSSFIAVAVGIAIGMAASPGSMLDGNAMKNLPGAESYVDLAGQASGGVFDKIEDILFRIVPTNIIAVASEGQMLGMIFFALLFGFFSARIPSPFSEGIQNFWNGTFQVMMQITQWMMKAMPLGVFGLMANVVAKTGFGTVKPVAAFFVCVVAGLVLFVCVFLPILLKIVGRVSPLEHFRAVAPALMTAFSTSSTAATLPITLECMEKRAAIPNRICSFVLPLGTSLNLAGSALYTTVTVIFIAQAYGLNLHLAHMTTIASMGLFTGLGMVAGIPSASLVTTVVVLQSLGLPADGVILVLAVERILDMFRTTANVFSNTCCAALVHHLG